MTLNAVTGNSAAVNVIEKEVLTKYAEGEIVIIPQTPMIQQNCSYKLKILQLPIKLCLYITVNKIRGQTFFCKY